MKMNYGCNQRHAFAVVQVKLYMKFGTPRISCQPTSNNFPNRSASITSPRLSPRLSQNSSSSSFSCQLSSAEKDGVSKGILRMSRYMNVRSSVGKSLEIDGCLLKDGFSLTALAEANTQRVNDYLERLDHQNVSLVKDMYGVSIILHGIAFSLFRCPCILIYVSIASLSVAMEPPPS
jgi:hypothetical protein